MLAALSSDSTGYRLLLLGHLLCVIVGFGSTFVYPVLAGHAQRRKGREGAAINDAVMATGKVVTTPFIYGAVGFGLLLVGLGDTYDWGDLFVQLALPLAVIAILFSAFVHIPNLDEMGRLSNELANMGPPPANEAGPPPQVAEMERRGKAAARNGGILHVLFAAILVLMVWRPL
jgi:hypothetical protein